MEHIQAFTDKLHAREDLSLACRCATLLALMALLSLPPARCRVSGPPPTPLVPFCFKLELCR